MAIEVPGLKSYYGDFDRCVWGYTLQNDWSIRDFGNPMDFGNSKNFDSSCSIGPCIVVDEIEDPQDIPFETHIDGQRRHKGNTRDMIWRPAEYLEYLSRDMTLAPGDMISAGTCAGCAMDSSKFTDGKPDLALFLKPGQTVVVSSDAIGKLTNPVVGAN